MTRLRSVALLCTLTLLIISGCAHKHFYDVSGDECYAIPQRAGTYLCFNDQTDPDTYYHSEKVFLVASDRVELVEQLSGGDYYEVSISPGGDYIALVENAGEGHPELSICELNLLLNGSKTDCPVYWNPYPGGVFDLSWSGDKLHFSSDIDSYEHGEDYVDIKYVANPTTGKISHLKTKN